MLSFGDGASCTGGEGGQIGWGCGQAVGRGWGGGQNWSGIGQAGGLGGGQSKLGLNPPGAPKQPKHPPKAADEDKATRSRPNRTLFIDYILCLIKIPFTLFSMYNVP